MKSKKNNTSWKPGQSGNPLGGPLKGCSWKEVVNARMDRVLEEEGEFITKKEAYVRAIEDLADDKKEDPRVRLKCVEFLRDTGGERPATPLEHAGAGGAPLEPPIINIVGVEANGKKDTKKKTKKKKTK